MSATTLKSISNRSAKIFVHPAAQANEPRELNVVKRIALPVREGIRFIRAQEIMRCESDGNYCKVRLLDGEQIMLAKTLKWMMSLLPKALFIRAHASHVIASDQVTLLAVDHLQLISGDIIPVPRARRIEVKSRLTSIMN